LKLAGDLALVRADPAQIEQVVMNLCLNARDALPHGGRIEIRTQAIAIDEELSKRIPHARPGQFVMLSVCDNGIGMDNDVLERIFEPFFTTKEPGQGTGLGLATVYGIVKQHEGFVNVDSQPHRGTTFRVYLPLVSTVDDTALAEKPVMDSETHETILVAEDSPGLREIAYEVLTSRGYRVILAADGVDAVQKFRAAQDGVDLLLLDVVMPGLSGPNAYKEIIGMKPDVPVVFTTGYGSEPTAGASVPSGGLLLHKPYTPQVLVEAVRSTLNRSRQETT
jgi:CheY-like chemotaxis protein